MAKITRKQYTTKLAELEAKLTKVQAELAEAFATDGASLAKIEDWNDLHDLEDDIEREIHYLESEWSTRNWTTQDWQQWDLITQNID